MLTAQERAAKAIAAVSFGKTFTLEQQEWLDRIQLHLSENLSIDADDFDVIPELEGPGGWGKASRAFEGKLDSVLKQLNEALAA